MQFFYYTIVSYALLLLLGAGWACFIVPVRLRAYTWVFAPFIGYSWGMLLTWYGFRLDFPGTNSYGAYIFLISTLLSVAGVGHRLRQRGTELGWFSRDTALGLLAAAIGLLVVSLPFATYRHGPTSISLGNNDIADYAGMGRLIQEFARSSTQGFLGQFGGFRVMSDEIWFGPAALPALLSTALGESCFRLQNVAMNLLIALSVPVVYALAREGFQLPRWYSFVIALLYSIHPVIMRVLYDGFHGQLLATALTPGFVLAGILCTREEGWRAKLKFVPLLAALAWAMIISYSFMLIFGVWTISAYALVDGLSRRSFTECWRNGVTFLAGVLVAFALSPFRVAMIYKQLALAKAQSGYFLGFLSPERLLGLLGSDIYSSDTQSGGAFVLMAVITVIAALGAWQAWRASHRELALLLAPLLVTYAFAAYIFFGSSLETRPYASYKAFKPLGVYLPVFFCLVFAAWWHLVRSAGKLQAAFAVLAVGSVLAAEARTSTLLIKRMRETEAVVTPDMIDLLKVDADPRIKSVNLFTITPWPCLWHTYFLMNKKLFLHTSWYARPKSLPVGDYDLLEPQNTDIAAPRAAAGSTGKEEVQYLNPSYSLAHAGTKVRLAVEVGTGWWGKEPTHRWTGASGNSYTITVNCDRDGARAHLIGVWYLPIRDDDKVTLTVNDQPVAVTHSTAQLKSQSFTLAKGRNVLVFNHTVPPGPPSSHDPRTLMVAWQEIFVELDDLPSK